MSGTPTEAMHEVYKGQGGTDALLDKINLDGFKVENPGYWEGLLDGLSNRYTRLNDPDAYRDCGRKYHELTDWADKARRQKFTLETTEQVEGVINELLLMISVAEQKQGGEAAA
jgi:hypothetical protein